jgi:hypothetical protein
MSILQSYPKGTPKKGDYIIGTSIPTAGSDEMPTTRNFSVSDVVALADIPFTSLTTNGTSGASTLVGGVLNIPNYTSSAAGVTKVIAGTNVTISPTTGLGDVTINATGGVTGSGPIGFLPIWTGTKVLGSTSALELNANGELTIPFYATPNRRNTNGIAFEATTGKIIAADSPNYTRSDIISASAGGSTTLDIDTPGIVQLAWLFNGPDGTFTINLPDTTTPSVNFNYFYGRKFKFFLSNYGFSAGGKDVVLKPFSTQKINGASSFTIPSNAYNVVEIWNPGGQWIIISKLIN